MGARLRHSISFMSKMPIRYPGTDVKCAVEYMRLEPSRKPEYIAVKKGGFWTQVIQFQVLVPPHHVGVNNLFNLLVPLFLYL